MDDNEVSDSRSVGDVVGVDVAAADVDDSDVVDSTAIKRSYDASDGA